MKKNALLYETIVSNIIVGVTFVQLGVALLAMHLVYASKGKRIFIFRLYAL